MSKRFSMWSCDLSCACRERARPRYRTPDAAHRACVPISAASHRMARMAWQAHVTHCEREVRLMLQACAPWCRRCLIQPKLSETSLRTVRKVLRSCRKSGSPWWRWRWPHPSCAPTPSIPGAASVRMSASTSLSLCVVVCVVLSVGICGCGCAYLSASADVDLGHAVRLDNHSHEEVV